MAKLPLPARQMIAFKIGARARKFAVEGCPIEGCDYLYGCLSAARDSDTELYAFLLVEQEKFEQRLAKLEEEEMQLEIRDPKSRSGEE